MAQHQVHEVEAPAAAEVMVQHAPAAEAADEANYIGKITVSTTECKPARAKVDGKRVPLLIVYGEARGIKQVEAPNGDVFTGVVGTFEAVNLETNVVYRSATLYLPNNFQEVLIQQLDAVAETKESKFDRAHVEFSLQIDAIPAQNPIGYTYVAQSLLPPKKADSLAHLRLGTQRRITEMKRLPAPAAA